MSLRNRGEKMSTRKENYNSCKRWTNWKGDVKTEHRMPQTGNLGAIQRHSLSRKLPKWLTMHKKNQDLSTATEFSFIKSQTCGNNYTVSFLTHLSKILLCIHFKWIVTKKQPPKSTVQKKKKIPTQSKLLLHKWGTVIQPLLAMEESTTKWLETISQLLCELCSKTTEIAAASK